MACGGGGSDTPTTSAVNSFQGNWLFSIYDDKGNFEGTCNNELLAVNANGVVSGKCGSEIYTGSVSSNGTANLNLGSDLSITGTFLSNGTGSGAWNATNPTDSGTWKSIKK
ncbi:MAG: hypothetical protein ABL923_11775 [Burkholderiaceae bacterium]